jgi:hypothetical protein
MKHVNGLLKAKLLITGDDSEARLITYDEYTKYLRTCNQLDFDTHLAIDVEVTKEELETLRSVVKGIEEMKVKAQLKLVSNE